MSPSRILSVDVGIRNFSYCVVDVECKRPAQTPEAQILETVRIDKWGVFDLCPPSDAPSKCDFCAAKCTFHFAEYSRPPLPDKPTKQTKSKPKSVHAPKKAKTMVPEEIKTNSVCCKRHASTVYYIPTQTKLYTNKYLAALPGAEISLLATTHRIVLDAPEFRTRLTNWADAVKYDGRTGVEKKKIAGGIYQWFKQRTCTPIVKVSASKVALTSVGFRLAKLAAEHSLFAGVDYLVIENQIGNVAVRMKAVQEMASVIAVFAGVPHIFPVSSAGKLTDITRVDGTSDAEPSVEVEEQDSEAPSPTTNVYRTHKLDGIARMRQWLDETESLSVWKEKFSSTEKTDDMSDSFLQAIWFARTHKWVADSTTS